ncbi:MAG: Ser-Thr-rich GPI-anchored membrane family protein, partial [Patescibacteria group bacterium]|nr:Ser-Thr-rich GPI-anchored membrane family protein [Patescibacteria group bacterium]
VRIIKRLIFIILFLGIFLFFNIFLGSSEGELKEKFNSLLSFNFLSSQPTESSIKWCHDFNEDLDYGDRGKEIEELQVALKKEGFNIKGSSENLFDAEITAAVIGFQEKYKNEILISSGISRGSGYVGKATRKKLNELYGCTTISTSPKKYYSTATPESNENKETKKDNPSTKGDESSTTSGLINGVCGSSNNLFLNEKPIYGLCSSGNPTEIIGSGPWYWACIGSNDGAAVFCYANPMTPEENLGGGSGSVGSGGSPIGNDEDDEDSEDDPVNPPITNSNPPGNGSEPEQLSVDLKINSSDNPSAVKFNSEFTASWTSTRAVSCSNSTSHHVPLKEGSLWTDLDTLPTSGSKILYARDIYFDPIFTVQTNLELSIRCENSSGGYVTDSVSLPVNPNINQFAINFPVGGANLVKGRTYNILWEGVEPEVTSYSIYLTGGSLGSTNRLLLGTANPLSGSFSWIVPPTIEAGSNYQIQIDVPEGETGGSNSGLFNIIATNSDLPDLIINDFSVTKADNLDIEINYCIKNSGENHTGKFYLMFSNLDNLLWGFFGVGFTSLRADVEYCDTVVREETHVSGENWYIEGDNRIQVTVDANVDIDEKDESNNESIFIFNTL